MALYANGNSVTNFNNFDFEHIPEEIKRFIKQKFCKYILQNKSL